jgi:cellulose synthase/poly-beta-1,6-N-acetylglucosamine synthase-like glycosyltransferase
VPPTWVRTITSYYTDNVAIVNGFTHQRYTGPFSGMQNLDFIYLLTIGCGTVNLNKPLSCIGNNMSYLKKAYDEVGGYKNLPFSVTEDFNLMTAIKRLGKYKIIFPLNRDSLVESLPCPDNKSLIQQKKRWIVGGLKLPFNGYVLGINGWLANLGMLLVPFLYTPTTGWLLFMKVLLDFMLLYQVTDELGIRKSMKYFPVFECYYIFYVLTAPLLIIPNRRVVWKDRTY